MAAGMGADIAAIFRALSLRRFDFQAQRYGAVDRAATERHAAYSGAV